MTYLLIRLVTDYFSFRASTAETGGTLRDVLDSLVRCHLALNDFDKADTVCRKLIKVGHVQNTLLLRLKVIETLTILWRQILIEYLSGWK